MMILVMRATMDLPSHWTRQDGSQLMHKKELHKTKAFVRSSSTYKYSRVY
jgi:hypothetical protein